MSWLDNGTIRLGVEIPARECEAGLVQLRLDSADLPPGEMRLKSVRLEELPTAQ